MAGTHVVKDFWQARVALVDANGETIGETGDTGLTVMVERFAGTNETYEVRLEFADYAGLEAEFAAGTAVTVLNASLTTVLGTFSWPLASKTASQMANIDNELNIA